MRKLTKKQIELAKRMAVYALMVLSVLITVVLITFFVMGFRFDTTDGQIEQYGLLQIESRPAGAIVTVDGVKLPTKTPTSRSVKAGTHTVSVARDGYDIWSKSVDVRAGTMKWLDYVVLVPTIKTVEPGLPMANAYDTLEGVNNRNLLVQSKSELPEFNLFNLSSDSVSSTVMTILPEVYSEPIAIGVVHNFQMVQWDGSGRYVLIRHSYGDKFEWLVMDTQNVNLSRNITNVYNIQFSSVKFAGSNGNSYFALDGSDVRKLDLAAATISRPLVSNVTYFDLFDAATIVYVGRNANLANEQLIGIYRDGDDTPYVVRTIADDILPAVRVATTRYFNKDYIAYSVGQTINIISGDLPVAGVNGDTSMLPTTTFGFVGEIRDLSFGPSGQYLLVQSGNAATSYDLEYGTLTNLAVSCASAGVQFDWINGAYIGSSCGDQMTIREFDGGNVSIVGAAVDGTDVVMTKNGRYLYSIGRTAAGFQLQRVRMILK